MRVVTWLHYVVMAADSSLSAAEDDFFTYGLEIDPTEEEMEWAHRVATPTCPWRCQLSNMPKARQFYTQVMRKPSCEACDYSMYPLARHNAIFAQRQLRLGVPITQVGDELSDAVPCAETPGLQVSGRTMCLVGHMAYTLMCFIVQFKTNPTHAYVYLEMAMDIAKFVKNDVGIERSCGDWGFKPDDIAWNYYLHLSHVFHEHTIDVPTDLQVWHSAPSPAKCPGPRRLELQEMPSHRNLRITVMCLVLAVLPKESKQAAAIVATFAADCDALFFVTASDGPSTIYGYPVINIRDYFPDVPTDSDRTGHVDTWNTIYKTLYMFLLVDRLSQQINLNGQLPDITCRLDADTLFIPDNLRRILTCRNFSSDHSWALGMASYVHKYQSPGTIFPFGGAGVCLSRGAIKSYGSFYKAGGIHPAKSHVTWGSGICSLGRGHWDDVVLGVCLQSAQIPLSRWSATCRGREMFLPFPYEQSLELKPPEGPMRMALAGSEGVTDDFNYWRYRSFQHFYCENGRWIGDFPVSFHRFGPNVDLALYSELRRGKRLPDGSVLRIWDGRVVDQEVCADLMC